MIYSLLHRFIFLLLLNYSFDNVTRLIRIITIMHTHHVGSHATFRRAVKRSYQQILFGSKPQLGYRYSSGSGSLGFLSVFISKSADGFRLTCWSIFAFEPIIIIILLAYFTIIFYFHCPQTEVSKTAISAAAAGIAGLCFVGYCIYFDRKRRSDPHFKSNLRKKRLMAKEHELAARAAKSAFPDFTDQQAVQRFFLQEVQMGESYLEQGDAARGVEHLANAVVVCGQPTELLNVLQRTLPDPVFDMLIKKLPELGKNLMRRQPPPQQPQQPPSSFGGPVISELDVSDVE